MRAITPFKVIQGHQGRHQSKALMPIIARSASAVYDIAKKVQLTLIGSPHELSNEPKTIIVRCP